MSFNRLAYDSCTYQHYLKEAVGPGDYMVNVPRNDCEGCFYPSPYVRIQRAGGATCEKGLIDVDSELMGITRRASRCPTEKYLPCGEDPCTLKMPKDCNGLGPEDTRLSNPPCTLRGTGWNRWEWLCQNPQDKALLPFQQLINNRQVVKDNHRPCVPKPLDQTAALPPGAFQEEPDECPTKPGMALDKGKVAESFVQNYPSIHWRSCNEIRRY